MTDKEEAQEIKINRVVEALRQAFKPLTINLTPDIEPSTVYLPQPVPPSSHDN